MKYYIESTSNFQKWHWLFTVFLLLTSSHFSAAQGVMFITNIPIMSATEVTISKYNNAFPPNVPTFLRLLIPLIPSVIVRKIIGEMKSLITWIKYVPSGCICIAVNGA